jgi:hypothetical protein
MTKRGWGVYRKPIHTCNVLNACFYEIKNKEIKI